MPGFTVDTTELPLVRVTYDGAVSDEAFHSYLKDYSAVLRAGQRYAAVFDATRAAVPSPRQRQLQADFIRENRDPLARLCLGGAFAISSPLVRGAMTAILWLAPLPFPYEIVSTRAEAERWARERLRRAGVDLRGGAS